MPGYLSANCIVSLDAWLLRVYIKLKPEQMKKIIKMYLLLSIPNHFKSNKKQEVSTDRLKYELQRSIENEDYELAIAIRDKMKKLENSQEEIEKLENELKQVISDHNFERAIEIREELKKLKM